VLCRRAKSISYKQWLRRVRANKFPDNEVPIGVNPLSGTTVKAGDAHGLERWPS
jgi:hypothetical protein